MSEIKVIGLQNTNQEKYSTQSFCPGHPSNSCFGPLTTRVEPYFAWTNDVKNTYFLRIFSKIICSLFLQLKKSFIGFRQAPTFCHPALRTKPRVNDHYCILAIYYCTLRKIWELLHSAHNGSMVHHTINHTYGIFETLKSGILVCCTSSISNQNPLPQMMRIQVS